MRRIEMRTGGIFAAFLLAGAALGQSAAAQTPTPQNKPQAKPQPILVEMFLSQSCGRCVDAAAFFSELADRENVVALGWHVDYWNSLDTTRGRWSDPFSSDDYSERQKDYNKRIRRRSSVYTPQIIVSGVDETIGSEREAVDELILTARATYRQVPIVASRHGNQAVFDIGTSSIPGDIYLVTYIPAVDTFVRRGENADMMFSDVNVVTDVIRIGALSNNSERITIPSPEEGHGCALIIQEPELGRVLGASYCALGD